MYVLNRIILLYLFTDNPDTQTIIQNKSNINSNKYNSTHIEPVFGISSDSESPTEPVSQQTIALLRAKVVPNKV